MTSAWAIDIAETSSHGEMVCISCNKKIVSGEYRYRSKSTHHDWYYQSQHRACCSDLPIWAERDRLFVEGIAEANGFSRACREFKKQWPDVNELDDYIRDDDGSQEGEPS